MAFTKTYQGSGSTDYSNPLAWALNSIRTAAYSWTASGSGTNEYYLRTAGGANPGFVATPPTTNGVYIGGTARTKASLGSLTANQWGFGDNDALGYSTVYICLASDPDTQVADYVQFRQIPQGGEYVRVPAGAGSIVSGLDQSAVGIENFIVEDGYDGAIGSSAGYLLLSLVDRVEFSGTGQAFLDVASSDVTVHKTGTADQGQFGLYLRGTTIGLLDARGGSIGVAALPGESTTVSTLRISNRGTKVKCGSGTTLTSVVPMFDGELWLHCDAVTITKYNGNAYLMEAAEVVTVNNLDGEFHWGSSGDITTYNARGGFFNMRASNASRTLSTLNRSFRYGAIAHNKSAVTITTDNKVDDFTENSSD